MLEQEGKLFSLPGRKFKVNIKNKTLHHAMWAKVPKSKREKKMI